MRPQHNPAGTWLTATQGVVFALAVYTFVLVWGYLASWSIAKHRVETAWSILVGVGWFTASLRAMFGPRVTWPPDAELGRPPGVVWFVLAAMLSLALHWSALPVGFLSDDFVLVGRALRGDFWSPGTTQFLRPVPLIAWAAIASVPVSTPVVVHALIIVLHGLNATLAAMLVSRLGFGRESGAAAGLFFLCRPASVEAVAWALTSAGRAAREPVPRVCACLPRLPPETGAAAELRDVVVPTAVEVLRGRDRASIVAADLPESLGGAYLFGSGFHESLALARERRVLPPPRPGARPCSLRWDGASFQIK